MKLKQILVPIALMLSCACATVEPFSIPGEFNRTTRALAKTMTDVMADRDDASAAEKAQAVVAHDAAILALGTFLYMRMSDAQRRAVDEIVARALGSGPLKREDPVRDDGQRRDRTLHGDEVTRRDVD